MKYNGWFCARATKNWIIFIVSSGCLSNFTECSLLSTSLFFSVLLRCFVIYRCYLSSCCCCCCCFFLAVLSFLMRHFDKLILLSISSWSICMCCHCPVVKCCPWVVFFTYLCCVWFLSRPTLDYAWSQRWTAEAEVIRADQMFFQFWWITRRFSSYVIFFLFLAPEYAAK